MYIYMETEEMVVLYFEKFILTNFAVKKNITSSEGLSVTQPHLVLLNSYYKYFDVDNPGNPTSTS